MAQTPQMADLQYLTMDVQNPTPMHQLKKSQPSSNPTRFILFFQVKDWAARRCALRKRLKFGFPGCGCCTVSGRRLVVAKYVARGNSTPVGWKEQPHLCSH